jgi:DNA-binding MarR family transcriptional regulator
MSKHPKTDAYQITWLVRRLFRAMGQKANDYLESLGISAAERAVMEFLYPNEELTVPEMAKRYKVTRQHIQVTVNSLLEKELVAVKSNPRHRRSPLLKLNDKGRDLFANVMKKDKQAIDQLFADVSESSRRQTRKTLEKLLKNLS